MESPLPPSYIPSAALAAQVERMRSAASFLLADPEKNVAKLKLLDQIVAEFKHVTVLDQLMAEHEILPDFSAVAVRVARLIRGSLLEVTFAADKEVAKETAQETVGEEPRTGPRRVPEPGVAVAKAAGPVDVVIAPTEGLRQLREAAAAGAVGGVSPAAKESLSKLFQRGNLQAVPAVRAEAIRGGSRLGEGGLGAGVAASKAVDISPDGDKMQKMALVLGGLMLEAATLPADTGPLVRGYSKCSQHIIVLYGESDRYYLLHAAIQPLGQMVLCKFVCSLRAPGPANAIKTSLVTPIQRDLAIMVDDIPRSSSLRLMVSVETPKYISDAAVNSLRCQADYFVSDGSAAEITALAALDGSPPALDVSTNLATLISDLCSGRILCKCIGTAWVWPVCEVLLERCGIVRLSDSADSEKTKQARPFISCALAATAACSQQ